MKVVLDYLIEDAASIILAEGDLGPTGSTLIYRMPYHALWSAAIACRCSWHRVIKPTERGGSVAVGDRRLSVCRVI